MDVSRLLESHGDDNPSGENLEYESVFMDMEIAAQPGEEKQAGDEILPAEDPDWADVAEKALAVLEQSHDLRAAVYYASAALSTKGLREFADATEYLRGCLEQYWDTCHPQLDADDDNDPTMRVNAVAGLSGADTVVKSLRRASLTESRTFGRISLRDIAIAKGEAPMPSGGESVPDSATISAAFQDTDPDKLTELLEAARAAMANIDAIEAKFSDETPGRGPDLDELRKYMRQAVRTLADYAGAEVEETEAEDAEDSAPSGAAPARAGGGGGGGPMGAINSPSDVSNALDRIISYYERNEPSSPLPILLKRAKRLVGADFLTIMKDMAPEGMSNVTIVGGLDEDSGDY